ncbi:MAG: hypothetical protein JWP31_421 [Aeromicrobium sp.]|nr:hypothetical protein [Aeromicrobium sp.]
MSINRLRAAAATAVTGVLLLSACGGSSSDGGGDAPRSSGSAKVEAVKGCEDAAFAPTTKAVSDIPRCEVGAPAAKPLAKKETITIAVPSDKISTVVPLMVGDQLGEFKKENIAIKVEIMPSTDAVQLVADGKVDAMQGSSSVAIFNAVTQDFDIRQIIGDGWLNPESKMGVWMRSDMDPKDLKGKKIGSAVGIGSSVNSDLRALLEKDGVKLSDLTWETIDVADGVTALENGAVDAAVLLDPFWLQIKDNPDFKFVAPAIPVGSNVGGLHAGPSLLKRTEVADAFVRAYARTVNSYFRDENWQDDDKVVEALAERTDQEVEAIRSVPGQIYTWDIPEGAATDLMDLYIDTDTFAEKEPLEESAFVDRSFIARAVGQKRP